MKRTRVLLVDDSPVFAQAAREFLAGDERLEMIGWASSGAEALERVETERPDIVLMDLHMPAMNGLDATTRIKAERFPPKVIVISLDDASENQAAAYIAGADAFLAKSKVVTHLHSLIERLTGLAGEAATNGPTNE